jgi:hypothetical protein
MELEDLWPKTLMQGIQWATLRIQSLIISLEHLAVASRGKADLAEDEAATRDEPAEVAVVVDYRHNLDSKKRSWILVA